MDQDVPFRSGDVLAGRYQLERELGSGGMGLVYAAIHMDLGRRVAIKLLHSENRDSAATAARFLLEARATARLNGPHVAKVLDIGRLDEQSPYLVMEYLEGTNLQQLLVDQGPQPVSRGVDFLLDACEALAEAHRAGIVHRDLKPANLFLTRDVYGDPTIKVLDFGISKFLEPTRDEALGLTDSRALMGSPVYMSPEQMRSARDVDHRTDIWSLGAVLFELLTGRPVWTGQSLSELCAQVARDPAPNVREFCQGASQELSDIITRCLQKDVVLRYQQVVDLALALERFASPQGKATLPRILLLAGHQRAHELPTDSGHNQLPSIGLSPSESTFKGTAATHAAAARRHWPIAAFAALLLGAGTLYLWLRPDDSTIPPHSKSSTSMGAVLMPNIPPPHVVRAPASSASAMPSSRVSAIARTKKSVAPTSRTVSPVSSSSSAITDPMSIRK